MKKWISSILLVFASVQVMAQTYQTGDIVSDYKLTFFHQGEEVSLYELGQDGGILVLEWFAWWCPFCASAANDVETGIVDYYLAAGGNPYGVKVKHIAINVEASSPESSISFINTYGFQTVLEDYNRAFFSLFNPGGGQPLFAIINAEPNSPSADQWELLYTILTYGSTSDPTGAMRQVIDQIEASVATPTLEEVFPNATSFGDGDFESQNLGIFAAGHFPWIYSQALGFMKALNTDSNGTWFYSPIHGFIYLPKTKFPFLYKASDQTWVSIQANGELVEI